MATLNIDLYDALKEAKVSEEKARAAATAFATATDAPQKLDKVDKRLDKLDADVQEMKVRLTLLQWMVGFNLAATMAVLWKLIK
jgi:hypothetical protein